MDFSPSERTRELARRCARFMAEEVEPREPAVLARGFAAAAADLDQLRVRARELRLFVPHLPAAWGGPGLSLLEFTAIGEILGRSPLGHYVCNCQAPDAGNMELLLRHGSPEQHERWLRPLVRGEIRSCFGMTEPEFPGSNPTWMGTRAQLDGETYLVDGHKWFSSGAEGAAFAIVMAISEPEAAPHQRASLLIVPTAEAGFEHVRNIAVMGEPGAGWASHGEIHLRGVRVPAANRIGAAGAGFALAQERLGPGRIHHCVRWLGICERAFELLCRRASSRELAPGDPLSSRQIVQIWIAECRAAIDSGRLLVQRTAWRIDREGAAAARTDISLIKFQVAEILQTVLDRAIQVHGALGLTDATPLAFWWRHERGARIYDGPDEVHKAAVARQILSAYRPRGSSAT
jgi:acyl-CoA dehydrogenase